MNKDTSRFEFHRFDEGINRPANFDLEGNLDFFQADEIKKVRSLGEGGFGEVHEAELKKGSQIRRVVLKDYPYESWAHTAYNNYLRAKKAGLKVFPTVRLSGEGKQLLMTLADNSKFYLPDWKAEIPSQYRADTINNIQPLLEDIKKNIILAVLAKIELRVDAYFFLIDIDKDNPKTINFVIGDYDTLSPTKESDEANLKEAVRDAREGLNDFVSKYIYGEEKVQDLTNIVNENLNELLKLDSNKLVEERERLIKNSN